MVSLNLVVVVVTDHPLKISLVLLKDTFVFKGALVELLLSALFTDGLVGDVVELSNGAVVDLIFGGGAEHRHNLRYFLLTLNHLVHQSTLSVTVLDL